MPMKPTLPVVLHEELLGTLLKDDGQPRAADPPDAGYETFDTVYAVHLSVIVQLSGLPCHHTLTAIAENALARVEAEAASTVTSVRAIEVQWSETGEPLGTC